MTTDLPQSQQAREDVEPRPVELTIGFDVQQLGARALEFRLIEARLLALEAGRLEKGAPADLVVIDLNTPWVVDREQLRARSKNSPFDEQKMQGRVLRTVVAGRTVYQYGVADRN